jgi:hypothetical protein
MWSFTPTTALPEGLHQVKATATDEVGDVSSDSEERGFTIDTVPPEAPVVIAPGTFVTTQTPVIAGTAEPGSRVVVRLNGAVAGTAMADAAGAWSLAPDTTLTEGLHQAAATATDNAGNTSPDSEERGFTVDTMPPEAPVVAAPGSFTNTRSPVFLGTSEPGCTVKVWLGDDETKAEIVTVDAEGNWRFIPLTAMEFGYHSLFAISTDASGNRSAKSQHQFAIQKSHYGWSCATAPALPATWVLFVLALSLGRRHRAR